MSIFFPRHSKYIIGHTYTKSQSQTSNDFFLWIFSLSNKPKLSALELVIWYFIGHSLFIYLNSRKGKDEQRGGRVRSRQKLTKSLCKSLLRCGDIFIAPMNTKNNPNRIDKLFSTTDELTLFWAIVPVGGGWAFCEFGEVVIVQLVLSLAELLFFSLISRVPQLNLSRFINETLDRLKWFNWFTFSHN